MPEDSLADRRTHRVSRSRSRCLVVATAALALTSAVWAGAPTPKQDAYRRTAPLEWGLYQILWSREYNEQLKTELSRFASKPNYVMFYRDLGRPFPKLAIDSIDSQGATTIVSLELWQWHGQRKGSYLPAIRDGEFDKFFRRWAMAAKTDGRRVLLRFGFEFNGNWFTWGGDPKALVAAWRHAHDIFSEVGATNVEWIWSPNVTSVPETPANAMHHYYPGDAYVDWVGVDGYNFGDDHDPWHKWQSCASVFDGVLKDFQQRYPTKPAMLAEFGCAHGKPGQRGPWIRNAHAALIQYPQLRAVIWFNYDKRREREPNWRIDVTAASLRAFNESFAAPQVRNRAARTK